MASMGIYDYELLKENKKADMLWEKGTFLSSRAEGKMKYNLYALWSFYVEVFYDPEKNKMTKFRTFKSITPLEPYLDQVALDDLL